MAHRRVIYPTPRAGLWRIGCSCGWKHELGQIVSRSAAERILDRAFVEHIPADRRRVYLLVDQRNSDPTDDSDSSDRLAMGNFIMPEGKPCNMLRWWQKGGLYYGRAQGFGLGDPVLELPIGEIRLEDGRVFRTE